MRNSRLYSRFKVYLENEILKEIITDNNCCTPEEAQRGEEFAKRTATFLINDMKKKSTGYYKKKVMKQVYSCYIDGVPLEIIAVHLELSIEAVNEMIDFINEIYI